MKNRYRIIIAAFIIMPSVTNAQWSTGSITGTVYTPNIVGIGTATP